jgi:hypothetical protein
MVARLVKLLLGLLGLTLYTWVAAVRSLPRVRFRKAARRAKRRAGQGGAAQGGAERGAAQP